MRVAATPPMIKKKVMVRRNRMPILLWSVVSNQDFRETSS